MGTSLVINFGIFIWWFRLYWYKRSQRKREVVYYESDEEADEPDDKDVEANSPSSTSGTERERSPAESPKVHVPSEPKANPVEDVAGRESARRETKETDRASAARMVTERAAVDDSSTRDSPEIDKAKMMSRNVDLERARKIARSVEVASRPDGARSEKAVKPD